MPTRKQSILQHLAHARQIGVLPLYRQAASTYNIPVEILLAKDSRESWLGSYPGLKSNGWYGSDGKSRGISQLSVQTYPEAKMIQGDAHDWFIDKGAQALRAELDRFNGNTKAALAAYNTGAGDVRQALQAGEDPDKYTTDKNYAADVLQRAQIIKGELGVIPGLSFSTEAALKWLPGALLLMGGGGMLIQHIKAREGE